MPTPKRPHVLLRQWLESLPEWSRTLNEAQLADLAQGLADLLVELTSRLHIDLDVVSDIADYVDGRLYPRWLSRQARAHAAQMLAICTRPQDFVSAERHSLMEVDFEGAYGSAIELRERIVSRMGMTAWGLWCALRRLPGEAAPLANGDVTKIAIAISELYLRVTMTLQVGRALEKPIADGRDYAAAWKSPPFPTLACNQVIGLMELCRHPDLYMSPDLLGPEGLAEQQFRRETIGLVVFLAELKAARA